MATIQEATKTLMKTIQRFDPINATRIMGYIMIQDQGEQEIIRLTLLPDEALLSYINQAKACLGLTSNNNTAMIQNSPLPQAPDTNGFHLITEPSSSSFSRTNSSQYHQLLSYDNGRINSNNFFPGPVIPGLDLYGDNGFKDVLLGSSGGSGSMIPFSSGFEEFDVRPCKYYARGICRNSQDCKFRHGDPARVSPIGYGRCSRSMSSFGKKHSGSGSSSSASQQIYLTFPANSTFEDHDVYDYFSQFGPVNDVRIPYQMERNFGFVSFVYPETVSRLLSMRTPHKICNSNVMVKPYKEKEGLCDKKQLNQLDLENRGRCSISSRSLMIDPRQLYDLPSGPRLLNSHDTFRRRLLGQDAELLGLSMEDLQLTDTNNRHNYHHYPYGGIPSSHSIPFMNHHSNVVASSSSNVPNQEALQELQDSSKSLVAQVEDNFEEGKALERRSLERFLSQDNIFEPLNTLPPSFKRDIGGGGADQSKN